jgi:ferrochelatase
MFLQLLLYLTVLSPVTAFAPIPRANRALSRLHHAATAFPPEVSTHFTSEKEPQVGVLLLNLGGPETGDDVEGFLFNLFADPDIIRLPTPLAPLQNLIAYAIARRRTPKSRAAYESIGGGSPILQYTKAQRDLIVKALEQRHNLPVKSYIGMRYWHPFTEEALQQIERDQISALVIIPLYPQFSISTSGSSLRVLQEHFAKFGEKYGNMVHTVVPAWYDRPGYVKAMANLIRAEIESFSPEELAEAPDQPVHVLFSAHGVPESYIEAGDPYQRQIQDCVKKISATLPDNVEVHLSYQSRVGPIEWLRPYTDDVLPELGAAGVKNLVVVPISFVSEHIETLEEIDIEYRELAHESGITNWRRCPALNTDMTFINDMADMVVEALNEPRQTITEACIANNCGGDVLEDFDARLGLTGVQGVGAEADLRVASRLREKERINGRVAMFAIALTVLIELLSGRSLTHMLGF